MLDELYQERIHDTVYSQLGNIAKMPTKDRKTALEALFNDLTCEIADVVKGLYWRLETLIFGFTWSLLFLDLEWF